MRIHPIAVKPLNDYILRVTFSNGEHRLFDVKPYLDIPFFAPLKNVEQFQQVFINDFTVEWKNGRDIAPHELYDDSDLSQPPYHNDAPALVLRTCKGGSVSIIKWLLSPKG